MRNVTGLTRKEIKAQDTVRKVGLALEDIGSQTASRNEYEEEDVEDNRMEFDLNG